MKLILDLSTENYENEFENRGILINKFIEKFPKVKLETIIGINKYYNKKIKINGKKNISSIIDEIYIN